MNNSKKTIKIVITGGHSTPAIALIEEIKKKHPQWKIYYFGAKYAFEGKSILSYDYRIVAQIRGIDFVPLNTGRLQRKFTLNTIPSLLKIPFGFLQALIYLVKIRPAVIVSFGGYLSLPVVVAGWCCRIPSLTHEQTQTIGLANKINSFFVKKIALSFPQASDELPSEKVVFTGPLLRNCLKNKIDPGEMLPVKKAQEKTQKPILYVTGGKSGAQFINQLIFKNLSSLLRRYIIVHQTGGIDFPLAKKKREKLNKDRRDLYWPQDYLSAREVGWVLNNASLAVSRAGANTVSELIALKKPALLIPIPWSYKNEQKRNALYFSSLGLGEVIDQDKAEKESFLRSILELEKKRKKIILREKELKPKKGRKLLLREIEKILSSK